MTAPDDGGGSTGTPPCWPASQLRPDRPPRRPGRPAIPKKDRGQRPYDPRWGTPRRLELIFALHLYREELERGDLTHCELAKHLSTSISYLSTTKNCPWGQDMLRRMAVLERDKIAKAEGSEN